MRWPTASSTASRAGSLLSHPPLPALPHKLLTPQPAPGCVAHTHSGLPRALRGGTRRHHNRNGTRTPRVSASRHPRHAPTRMPRSCTWPPCAAHDRHRDTCNTPTAAPPAPRVARTSGDPSSLHPLAPAACARIKRAVQGWLSTAASANQLQLQCTTKTTRRPPSARASALARPFGAAPREPQIHISTASCAMPCTPLAQDLQGHAPAQRAAPNRRPRPVRTRAAPTGLTPRLHTAGVGGAGAPAREGEGRRRSRCARILTRLPAPQNWATASPTHTRARHPTPHHARARANPGHAGPELARWALLCSDDSSHGVPAAGSQRHG